MLCIKYNSIGKTIMYNEDHSILTKNRYTYRSNDNFLMRFYIPLLGFKDKLFAVKYITRRSKFIE